MLWVVGLAAQDPVPVDTVRKGSSIIIDNADQNFFKQVGEEYEQRHFGNVRMRQDSVYFRADTAIKIFNEMNAWGEVSIQQGDSLSVFSDSLFYDGDSLMAYLEYNVSMVDRESQLFTDRMVYDVDRKIGTYTTGGLLINQEARLISRIGQYVVEQDMMYFRDSVRVTHPDFLLKADSLAFNVKQEIAYFEGPTLITFDSARIYCESGSYTVGTQRAVLSRNAQFVEGDIVATGNIILYDGVKEETTLLGYGNRRAYYRDEGREAYADTIIYNAKDQLVYLMGNVDYADESTHARGKRYLYNTESGAIQGMGRGQFNLGEQILIADSTNFEEGQKGGTAQGGVIWIDTVSRISLFSEELDYRQENEEIITGGGRPLFLSYSEEGDSVFIAADTLYSKVDTQHVWIDSILQIDSVRMIKAFYDVRIWSEDMSGVCDSLVYRERDSVFILYGAPVLWSDSAQIFADTIYLHMKEGAPQRLDAIQNAFMIEQVYGDYFQQVKSRNMEAQFKEGRLNEVWAKGNAQMYYYILDESDAFMGMQEASCSSISARFDSTGQVDAIIFYQQIGGKILPIEGLDPFEKRYPGFRWEMSKKPIGLVSLGVNRRLTALVRPEKKILMEQAKPEE